MTDIKDALDHARAQVQELHKSIEAQANKDHAAIRASLQTAGEHARDLGLSVRVLAERQGADVKDHLKDVAAHLDEAAKHAKTAATASAADVKNANRVALERTRDALQSLSKAVAAHRSTAVKS